MSKFIKIFGSLVLILALLAVGLWGFWAWFSRQALPKTSGSLAAAGLHAPVEIVRDAYDVPHIYAHDAHDLFYALGYTHAQERFWQMEFERRTAAGRLSEILGDATLETDIYLRHFGFVESTSQAYQLLDDVSRASVDAYADGVNAYISERKPAQLGLEFALLGLQGVDFEIEPWTPVDAMIWGEMLIFDQSDRLRSELRNLDLLFAVGETRYLDFLPPYREDRPVIIPTEEMGSGQEETPLAGVLTEMGSGEISYLANLLQHMDRLELGPAQLADLGLMGGAGSNSFAVSGALAVTGTPMLANDPHMSVNMPALWYEVGLHCLEKTSECPYNLRGFSLPGVPVILIGHNDRIAWGLTNAYFDAEDVFIEHINPQNPNQYEVNGEWVDMDIRREEIQVRGRTEPVVIFVRTTRNGLVASDRMVDQKPFAYEDDQLQLYALSYAWTALGPVQSVRAGLMLNRAQNWEDFLAAAQYFEAGKQNWLYADVDGNIGYVMPGKVPIRAGGDGMLPVPGWNDDYRWTGFIPFEQAPKVFNPSQGFIVTGNNPQLRAEDYPFLLGVIHDRGQRAERITEMLQADTDGITQEDMIAIQTDNKSLSAEEIIPYLKGLSFSTPEMETARNTLLNWDAQMTMDSSDAALFNMFWVQLIRGIYADEIPENRLPTGESYTSDYVATLLESPQDLWWDDITTPDVVETRDDILIRAFETAYLQGVDELGRDLTQWQWGDLHQITFRNATLGSSGIALIENIFNRGPFPVNGSESVVQKTCWNAQDPYQVTCIPALRQVIDLGDLSNSLMVHSVGQSGHPMDAHYDDFIDDWRLFRYHPSNWTREQAESGAHSTLVLQPDGQE
jgi:penicillin amidase